MDQETGIKVNAGTSQATLTTEPHLLTISSGKGGVGKTCLSTNLALAIKDLGLDVLLVDFDFGLANVDVLLGLDPAASTKDYLEGKAPLEECIVKGPRGLKILPAPSGPSDDARLHQTALPEILDGVRGLPESPEVVILDTAAGIGTTVLDALRLADDPLLVTTPEPTALTDAYGTIKALAALGPPMPSLRLVVNQADSMEEAFRTTEKLISVARRFLSVEIDALGWLPRDRAVLDASLRQKPFLLEAAASPASRCTRFIASKLATRVRSRRRKHGNARS